MSKKLMTYGAVLLALFFVAFAPATAADVLYVGNFDYPGGTIYPTLLDPNTTNHTVTQVAMYNAGYTGPSSQLLAIAEATVNTNGAGGFSNYDFVFYDMGEFWYYPFGNTYDEFDEIDQLGAYDLANTAFVALRSAPWGGTTHLAPYQFRVIDDSTQTAYSQYFIDNPSEQTYLLAFFDYDLNNSSATNLYDVNDSFFIGDQSQADGFVDYFV